jgi:hypothetical protein
MAAWGTCVFSLQINGFLLTILGWNPARLDPLGRALEFRKPSGSRLLAARSSDFVDLISSHLE